MFDSIFFGGLNATGKTTIIRKLQEDDSFFICQGSCILMKRLGIKEGDYESLERLPDDIKDKEISAMIKEQMDYAILMNKKFVFVGHFGRIKNKNVESAIKDWIAMFDLIVLTEANPDDLIARINHDSALKKRKRSNLSNMISNFENPVSLINSLLVQTKQIATQVSEKNNIPILFLNSSAHNATFLSKKLINYIKT